MSLFTVDPEKCKLCRDCIYVCPSNIILGVNFPERKDRPAAKERRDKKLARTSREEKQLDVELEKMAKDTAQTDSQKEEDTKEENS